MRARRTLAAACLAAGVLAGCSPWQKAAEAWRAREGGSRPYATLEGTKWHWRSGIVGSEVIAIAQPARYTLEFQPDHRVAIRADCNRGIGAWSAKLDTLTIGPLGLTRVACPAGSLSRMFTETLESVRVWYVRDGALFLELPESRGTLRFELADAAIG